MGQVFIGKKLLDRQGNAIGKVTDIIVNTGTLEPEWITVKTGMLGGERLVPTEVVQQEGEEIAVPFDRETVKSAPTAHKDHVAPSVSERAAIYGYYDMPEL